MKKMHEEVVDFKNKKEGMRLLKRDETLSLKNICYIIILMIGLFYGAIKLLSTSDASIFWTIGALTLYLCSYLLIEIFGKVMQVEKINNIIPIFLKLLVPLHSLKIINRLLYKKNIYLLLGIIISSIVILGIEYYYNKDRYTKEIFSLDEIQSTFVSMIPFFLLRSGSNNILILLSPIIIAKIYRKGKLSKEQKNIGILIALFLITLIISTVFNEVEKRGIKDIRSIITAMLAFFILINGNKKNIDYKNIILVATSSIGMIYISMLTEAFSSELHFFATRHGSFIGINETGLILGVFNLFFLYLMKEKKEFLPYLILNSVLLFSTGSKGASLLTIIFLLVIIVVYTKSKIQRIALVSTFIIGLLIIFNSNILVVKRIKSDDGSNSSRVTIYKESFRQFLEKPLLGHGPGTYTKVSLKHNAEEMALISQKEENEKTFEEFVRYDALALAWHSHNNILVLLRSSGIFSLIFYINLIGYLIYLMISLYIKRKESIVLLGLVAVAYFGLYGMIDNIIFDERLQLIHFLVIALVYLYVKKTEDEPSVS